MKGWRQFGSSVVFVDLSNVCKDETLGASFGHATWARWELLRQAWLRTQDPRSTFVLVADSSLRRALSRTDEVRLEQAAQSGSLIEVPDADVEVLNRALEAQGTALSNDKFKDHRRI